MRALRPVLILSLLIAAHACEPATPSDAGSTPNDSGGLVDTGSGDAAVFDVETQDSAVVTDSATATDSTTATDGAVATDSATAPDSAVADSATASDAATAADSAVADSAQPDAWAPDTWAPDTWAPDTWAPDTWAPDTWAPDTWAPDTWAPDTWAPDTWAPDAASPDSASADAGSSGGTLTCPPVVNADMQSCPSYLGNNVVSLCTCGSLDQAELSCNPGSHVDRTYCWSAPSDGTFRFDLSQNANTTLALGLFRADESCQELGCSAQGAASVVDLVMTTGQRVYIVLDEISGNSSFTLAINKL